MEFHENAMTALSSDAAASSSAQAYYKKSFVNHVFSGSDESKAEFINAVQYSLMGIAPVVALNKLIQRFSPDADPDKPAVEILAEIFIQIIIMFCGIIVIHRVITYFPTYSGFKYDRLEVTHVVLAFLILILSIQTKIGIKVNILFDRLVDLFEGDGGGSSKNQQQKNKNRGGGGGGGGGGQRLLPNGLSVHSPSQADYLDNSSSPSLPASTSRQSQGGYDMMRGVVSAGGGGGGGGGNNNDAYSLPIMAANSLLGSSFGSAFY